ncbi:MAG: ABC transporter permease, partial [Planctomycetota bacterium]
MLAFALPAFLPLATRSLVERYRRGLLARAESTPLLCGAPGSRFDLVLASLEFRGRAPRSLARREFDSLRAEELGRVVPLRVGHSTAKKQPIVGTTPEYFELRRLQLDVGTLPLWTGDCVLGEKVARDLGLKPGDTLSSDVNDPHNLAGSYPLELLVTGVFQAAGSADDRAIFTSLETAWILEGLGHGHVAPLEASEDDLLGERDSVTVFSPAVREHQSLGEEQAEDFHFHGDPALRPLSSVLLFPDGPKERTLLRGRLSLREDLVSLAPREVVLEMIDLILRAKSFFDANALLVAVAGLLALGLMASYAWQVRSREMRTLRRLGGSSGFLLSLFGGELLFL